MRAQRAPHCGFTPAGPRRRPTRNLVRVDGRAASAAAREGPHRVGATPGPGRPSKWAVGQGPSPRSRPCRSCPSTGGHNSRRPTEQNGRRGSGPLGVGRRRPLAAGFARLLERRAWTAVLVAAFGSRRCRPSCATAPSRRRIAAHPRRRGGLRVGKRATAARRGREPADAARRVVHGAPVAEARHRPSAARVTLMP